MELDRAKGMKDVMPAEKQAQNSIQAKLVSVFERFGFSPLDTPIVERFDVLASKYAGGDMILKEVFKVSDQGDRELALRYDLTVPLARVIGMNPTLKMPFKRYAIGPVFRDGPIATGRFRQFTQCDVDIVGSASVESDIETLALAGLCLEELGLKARIRLNSRPLLEMLLKKAGVKKDIEDVMMIIDKLDKIQGKGVEAELKEKGLDKTVIANLASWMWAGNTASWSDVKKVIGDSEATTRMDTILTALKQMNVQVSFDPSLARGLAYYTGIIYEVYADNSAIKSAIAAGGRWDAMIGNFLGKGEYPAVGISFGLERMSIVLQTEEVSASPAQAYLIPIKTQDQARVLAIDLRRQGVRLDVDLMNRGVSKNLTHAASLGIPFAIIYGSKEAEQNKVTLRDLKSGKEELVDVKEVVQRLQQN